MNELFDTQMLGRELIRLVSRILRVLVFAPIVASCVTQHGEPESSASPMLENSYSSECVILLHGLARTSGSMKSMEEALKNAGYRTINYGYPSRQYEIEELAASTITSALELCSETETVNFVTHSVGGILVRQYLEDYKIENLGRVVMLGPPNKGSEVVDALSKVPGFKAINGPAGFQLGTGDTSVPNRLGPADFSLGIIAGTKTINLILSTMLPQPNDGKVSVESTKLEGMSDHISLPVSHPFLMKNEQVISQVLYFLRYGEFDT